MPKLPARGSRGRVAPSRLMIAIANRESAPGGKPITRKEACLMFSFGTSLPAAEQADQAALESAIRARQEATCCLNEATEPDLIDAAIFEYQAADKRLNHLLRKMKKATIPS